MKYILYDIKIQCTPIHHIMLCHVYCSIAAQLCRCTAYNMFASFLPLFLPPTPKIASPMNQFPFSEDL